MLECLFGWRKASRCKDLLKRVRCRLKLLRNKRGAIVKQERDVIAQLLKNGQHPTTTLSRAEQLFRDQSILAAYDLLDHFCEFIIINLSYIRKHKDCPNDINEAVSTLIFSAVRCGNLPELQLLRKLFGQRYGSNFEVTAVEAFPGTHVNQQMRKKLSVTSVTEDAKFNLIQGIMQEYNLKPQVDDSTLWYGDHVCEKDVFERDIKVVYSEIRLDHVESYANEVLHSREAPIWDDICYDKSNHKRPPKDLYSSQESSDTDSDSHIASKVKRYSSDHGTCGKSHGGKILTNVRRMSFDFSYNFKGKHQELKELKPISSSSNSSNRRKPSRQRPRGRSTSGHPHRAAYETGKRGLPRNIYFSLSHSSTLFPLCTKDVESLQYYDGISDQSDTDSTAFRVKEQYYTKRKNSRRKRSSRTSSKISSKGSTGFSFQYDHEKKSNQQCKYANRRSSYTDECSLDQPCYFLASDCDNKVRERLASNTIEINLNRVSLSELGSQVDPASVGQNAGGSRQEEGEAEHGSLQLKLLAPYLRTISMPVELSKKAGMNEGARSSSFRHVHPKLPDYEDLAAIFTALKDNHVKNSSA